MKHSKFYFITFLFFGTILSCKDPKQNENANLQKMNLNDLKPSPIQQDSLSSLQIKKINEIYTTFSEVNLSSLEETITNFKRDLNPDNEIEIWLAMAKAFSMFKSKHKNIDIDKKKEAYKLILMRSMYNEKEAQMQSELKLLNSTEIEEIFSYYNLQEKPITIISK